jgi:hypothetical protein
MPRKSSSAEKTATAKKSTTKKAAAETKETPAEKPVKEAAAEKQAEKPAKETAAAKKTSEKVVTKIQYDGNEYDLAEIIEKAKADYKANNKGAVKSLNVYIKPEDKAAYYVVNDKVTGKVDL